MFVWESKDLRTEWSEFNQFSIKFNKITDGLPYTENPLNGSSYFVLWISVMFSILSLSSFLCNFIRMMYVCVFFLVRLSHFCVVFIPFTSIYPIIFSARAILCGWYDIVVMTALAEPTTATILQLWRKRERNKLDMNYKYAALAV